MPEALPKKPTRQLMRFRGRSYVAYVLSPQPPIAEWLEEVDATLVRSPNFFAGKPVLLDLAATELSTHAIRHLVGNLQDRGIRVLGFEGVAATLLAPDLPPLLNGGRDCGIASAVPNAPKDEIKEDIKAEPEPEATGELKADLKSDQAITQVVSVAADRKTASLLLESPVRSGQSIVFMEGDVTVLGSVGSGAEIVAGGSIHIYGTLRGRAMAGVNGNHNARIFCNKIEAELLAIDGFYQTADDIDASLRNRPAQVWLEGNSMKISALN